MTTINPIQIKICGMRDARNVAAVSALKPDYLGFIFYGKSPRYVGDDWDPVIAGSVPAGIRKIGVFVDATEEEMADKIERYGLDGVQLHGSESTATCARMQAMGMTVIKVFGMREHFDFGQLDAFVPYVDYFLFDTAVKEHGGSGRKFAWDMLAGWHGKTPFFLSGGIGPDDVDALRELQLPGLHAVDVNSRFERAPGEKDVEQCRLFMDGLMM